MAGETYAQVIGPLLIGSSFAALLCGILLHQSVLFAVRFPRDSLFHKILVLLVTLISVLGFCTNINNLWWDAISTRGNDTKLQTSTSTGPVAVGAPVFAAVLNQSFFCRRAWKLTHGNLIICTVLGFLIFGCFVQGLAMLVMDCQNRIVAGSQHSKADLELVTHMIESWLWLSAGVDLAITGVISWRLSNDRQGFNPRTDTIVRRLLFMTISTGTLTSVFATVDAIVMITTVSKSNAEIGFSILLPHLYGLTLVGTLNLRGTIGSSHSAKHATPPTAPPTYTTGSHTWTTTADSTNAPRSTVMVGRGRGGPNRQTVNVKYPPSPQSTGSPLASWNSNQRLPFSHWYTTPQSGEDVLPPPPPELPPLPNQARQTGRMVGVSRPQFDPGPDQYYHSSPANSHGGGVVNGDVPYAYTRSIPRGFDEGERQAVYMAGSPTRGEPGVGSERRATLDSAYPTFESTHESGETERVRKDSKEMMGMSDHVHRVSSRGS